MARNPVDELWAKTQRGTAAYHPLFCHLVDVGWVAHEYLASDDAAHLLRVFAQLFGISEDDVRGVVPFLVSTHDIGKASPSFEKKALEQWRRVVAAGWPSEVPLHPHAFRHDREAATALAHLLRSEALFTVPGPSRRVKHFYQSLAFGLGGHHGRFYTDFSGNDYPEIEPDPSGPENWSTAWRNARRLLLTRLRSEFGVPSAPISGRPGNLSALSMVLCGFTILCDWIGSDQVKFPPYSGPVEEYSRFSRGIAREALRERRLLEFVPIPSEDPTFRSLFPQIKLPRPLQRALDPAELPELPRSMLAIVEAPTGEGKTEAALLLASRLAYRTGPRGFYFALPTMATSNQMGQRVERFLREQLPEGERANLMLVHGQAGLSEQLARLLTANQHDALDREDRVVADSWLLPRKRSLLSPYATGTVDQALVCALNVRHGALRMLGLAGKVVIVDEVHAYDLYMSTILDRLLAWLRAIGASVVLLSATLPSGRRRELIAAFRGNDNSDLASTDDMAYPLITLAGAQPDDPVRKISGIAVREQKAARVERWPDGVEERGANVERVLAVAAGGGCAAWICNTVGEAQAVYRCLRTRADRLPADQRTEIFLFHARFPLGRRQAIESTVLEAFGPEPARRPKRAVLVGTQVIEQSLDLDFDLMVSQLAPIDLLIQRLGRLQRHERQDRGPRFTNDRRFILLDPPPRPEGGRSFGDYGQIYEPWLLYKTLAALAIHDRIRTPTDVRPLIEAVYDDRDLASDELAALGVTADAIEKARAERSRGQGTLAEAARTRLVNIPGENGTFLIHQSIVGEDEAEDSELVSAQTRYARPSVRVILLDASDPLFLALRTGHALTFGASEIRSLLLRSVTLNQHQLVRYLRAATVAPNRQEGGPLPLDGVRGLAGYIALPLEPSSQSWQDPDGEVYLRLDNNLGVLFKEEESDRG